MQRPAKPCTPVRFWVPPPKLPILMNDRATKLVFGS
jgi:hypothetical protein